MQKITKTSPIVAITSENHKAPDDRSFVDQFTASSSNMMFAIIAPTHPPMICTIEYNTNSRFVSPPNNRVTRETTGLKCAPEIGPRAKIKAISPPVVAAAFSSNCKPTSLGERRCAMMPEPTTTATKKAVPIPSANKRTLSEGREALVTPPVCQVITPQ